MSDTSVRLDIDDRVATIVLNRPDKLNAFSQEMRTGLIASLDEALGNAAVRVIILTGEGRAFSAGADLGERARNMADDPKGPDLGHSLGSYFNPIVRTIRSAKVPVIAAVNGTAAGAGANIALACDIVLAARSARFIQAFSKIGLIPDCGGTYFLPRLAGRARAFGMALLGDPITAEVAADWGLIWEVVDDDALMDTARAMAATLAQGPAEALTGIKKALNQSAENTLDQQLELERNLQQVLGHAADYREGVTAFSEKRKPTFR